MANLNKSWFPADDSDIFPGISPVENVDDIHIANIPLPAFAMNCLLVFAIL
jgi:hypothetical protein